MIRLPEPWRTVAEPLAAGALALGLLWVGLSGLSAGRVDAVLALLGGAISGAWALAAGRRGRLSLRAGRRLGPGLVRIDEGRIAYFGPETGGVTGLDALAAVAVEPDGEGGLARWVLTRADGEVLTIPGGALGADRLADTLGALPGFGAAAVSHALSQPGAPGPRIVWRREGPAGPALSPGAPPRA